MSDLVPTFRLTSEAALRAVRASVARGLEMGVRVNAAVVDAGGHLLAFQRADGAFLPSITIAQDKAYTAAGFGISSRTLYQAIEAEPDVRDGIAKQPRVATFPGGLPIKKNDEVIGGIGISGASADEDEQCAMAGLSVIGLL